MADVKWTVIQGTHTHIQTTPAIEWVIVHLLNTLYPVVDVWVNDGGTDRKVLPLTVEPLDALSVKLTFTAATAGRATII